MNWLKRVVYSINCMLLPLLYRELDILTDGVRVQITMLTTEMTVSYCEYVPVASQPINEGGQSPGAPKVQGAPKCYL